MKILSYTDKNFPSPEGQFTEDWPVQFQHGFSNFYEEYYQNKILFVEDEELNAWIPIRIIHGKLATFGQILHAAIRKSEEINAEQQKKFYDRLIEFLRKEKICHQLMQPHPSGIMLAVPHHAKSCDFGTYINELQQFDEEGLLNSFDPKYRKSVQHSIKNGGRIETGWGQFSEFYSLYKHTIEKAGIHCDSIEYFESLYKNLGDQHIAVGVVYDDQRPIGGIFMMYSRYAALCTHAGSAGESKLYGGMKHLHYAMMLQLREKGVRKYDLVGVRINSNNAGLEGIFRFKKGFGGVLKEGFLWKINIDPNRIRIYELVQRVRLGKKWTNYRDIIDQESSN